MIPEAVEARVSILSELLRAAGIPHAFGGAIAYVCYGLPRSTDDYDINIFLPEARAQEVFDSWDDQKVDLFFAYSEFHDMVATRIREEPISDERTVTVLSGEDIVVFKVIFNRPLDWRDLERLFQQGSATIDLDYVYHWLGTILGDDDSRIERLRETVKAAADLMAES